MCTKQRSTLGSASILCCGKHKKKYHTHREHRDMYDSDCKYMYDSYDSYDMYDSYGKYMYSCMYDSYDMYDSYCTCDGVWVTFGGCFDIVLQWR